MVLPFLERAHLHLIASLEEGQPVSVLEAGALAIPTVGTRVGHLADWGNSRARVVEVGDSRGLAREILLLLQDDVLRSQLGRATQAWVRDHDIDWMAQQFHQIYQELCGKR